MLGRMATEAERPPGDSQTEEALRASQAYMSAVIASALDGIVTVDRDGRIMDFNPAAQKIYGYQAEDVAGKSLLDVIVAPESRERQQANLDRWAATGQAGVLLP